MNSENTIKLFRRRDKTHDKITNKFYKFYPFIIICLSMIYLSIGAEAVHFTDGRLSLTGNLALMGISAGLIIWCIISRLYNRICDKIRRYIPVISSGLCLLMLFPANIGRYISFIYGISFGVFLASSLTGYLLYTYKNTDNIMLKIGFSAGIFTTAVYPFGIIYTLVSSYIQPFLLKISTFIFLAVFGVLIFLLNINCGKSIENNITIDKNDKNNDLPKSNYTTIIMIVLIVIFAGLNHFLNSGVLEQHGGTADAPYIFFINVALRLPMGIFMGYLADKGKWYYAIGFPLTLMVTGCAVSLFAGNTAADFAMLSVFNCGGAAIIMFIHILGMKMAMWKKYNSFAACLGSLIHFIFVSFFNINALHITPDFFGAVLRSPFTFAVIILSLPLFWLIMRFLEDEKLRETAQNFFIPVSHDITDIQTQPEKDYEIFAVTKREYEILTMLTSGKSTAEIAAELFVSDKTIRSHISNMIIKTNAESRVNLLNMAINGQIMQK